MPSFRTKARAVDLLGKGQIADLPTAITEMWKNGYDAYADNLEGHLYFPNYKDTKRSFLVISDDGTGMSETDILDKWIVIGTDSKTRKVVPKQKCKETLFKPPRIPTGEKGIGRLSVSYLGSQMIMITKKKDELMNVLFVDWRILNNYNLYVEDIQLPLKTVENNNNFRNTFNELINEFRDNFPKSKISENENWAEHEDLINDITSDLDSIELPDYFEEEIVNPLMKKGQDSHGTKFIIFNPVDQLLFLNDFDNPEEKTQDTINFIFSCLSGMSNVFKEKRITSFDTRFFIYDENVPIDIISQRDFFSFEDFINCDHVIEGTFDQYGFFKGEAQVYDKIFQHVFKPNRKSGNTPYGPFKIKFGYVEGEKKNSSLNDEIYNKMTSKLRNYSGLYVYRDGFRVLPYGRPDYDFLKIEEQRSKGTGYYYFSYRNMFGYIEISRVENKLLRDKAGREGFINNEAYQEFKSDLQEFFIDLARKYFRTNAIEIYRSQRKKEIEQEKEERKREKERRKEFNRKINDLPKKLKNLEEEIKILNNQMANVLKTVSVSYDDIDDILRRIERSKLDMISLKPPEPVRFKPTEHQRKLIHEYKKYYNDVNNEVLTESNEYITEAKKRLKEKDILLELKNKLSQYQKDIDSVFTKYLEEYHQNFSKLEMEINSEKQQAKKELDDFSENLIPTVLEREIISKNIGLLETMYHQNLMAIQNKIEPLLEHINKLSLEVDEDVLVGYYKLEYEQLKEKWEETQELAQLGIAVEIIDHQFNAIYSRLSVIISDIEDDLVEEDESRDRYKQLYTLFEHLENNYRLLSPLYKTKGRIRKEITGLEISEYIKSFYRKELKDKNIELIHTEHFNNTSLYTYESIIKPVFINIVNNAIYWMKPVEDRKIIFDFKDGQILIMNSGEPIDDIYIEGGDIFKLFFSRKPNGRGIGLYLAKTTLNSIGYDIVASNDPDYNRLEGACFIIRKNN